MKDQPKRRDLRVCQCCGRDCGLEGPRPTGSMLKLQGNVLLFACSVQCGVELGWRVAP